MTVVNLGYNFWSNIEFSPKGFAVMLRVERSFPYYGTNNDAILEKSFDISTKK